MYTLSHSIQTRMNSPASSRGLEKSLVSLTAFLAFLAAAASCRIFVVLIILVVLNLMRNILSRLASVHDREAFVNAFGLPKLTSARQGGGEEDKW
eukprot:m.472490 g.472490  ORF g.472490 m.472490 type:complete len:95 (+) comp57112_c0_seq4:909-1193(+)